MAACPCCVFVLGFVWSRWRYLKSPYQNWEAFGTFLQIETQTTVDGSEIRRSPVKVGSLCSSSHYSRGFIDPFHERYLHQLSFGNGGLELCADAFAARATRRRTCCCCCCCCCCCIGAQLFFVERFLRQVPRSIKF